MVPHSSSLELFSRLRDLSQPSPAHGSPPRRVEQVKVVAVAHARHPAEQTPIPKEIGPHVGSAWDSAQVIRIELQRRKAYQGEANHGCPFFGGC